MDSAFQEIIRDGDIFRKGAITEIIGERSSGRTGFIFSALAYATRHREYCAIIDTTDSFDPFTAQATGIELNYLLWIRSSGKLDPALKSADHILHAGGFSHVVFDLADVRPEIVTRIPLSYWYRFRLAAEKTQTILIISTSVPCTGSSSSTSLQCTQNTIDWVETPGHRILRAVTPNIHIRKSLKKMVKAQRREIKPRSSESIA